MPNLYRVRAQVSIAWLDGIDLDERVQAVENYVSQHGWTPVGHGVGQPEDQFFGERKNYQVRFDLQGKGSENDAEAIVSEAMSASGIAATLKSMTVETLKQVAKELGEIGGNLVKGGADALGLKYIILFSALGLVALYVIVRAKP